MNIVQKAWGWIKSLFNRTEIEKIFNTQIIGTEIKDNIKLWDSIFRNTPPWLSTNIKNEIAPLGIGNRIITKIAKVATFEGVATVSDTKLEPYFQLFFEKMEQAAQFTAAKGTIALKPFDINGVPYVDIYQPERFDITAVNALGEATAVIFTDTNQVGKTLYVKYEHRVYDEQMQKETITHKAFKMIDQGRLEPVALVNTPLWFNLADVVETTTTRTKPLFTICKTPIIQTIDYDSPLGLSYYHTSVRLLEQIDKIFSVLNWEAETGKRVKFVDELLAPTDAPQEISKMFVMLSAAGGIDDPKSMLVDHNPEMQHEAFIQVIDWYCAQVDSNMGLSRGTTSSELTRAVTATEIIAAGAETYKTALALQRELVRAFNHMGQSMYYILYSREPDDLEISMTFDDGVINDPAKEQETAALEVQGGLRSKLSYMMNIRGMTEQDALEEIAKIKEEEYAMIDEQVQDETIE